MMFPSWTDDPVRDAESYANYCEDRIKDLPVCSDCEGPIQDDYYYELGDTVICQKCMEYYRKWL